MTEGPMTTLPAATLAGLHKRAETAEIEAKNLREELARVRAQTDDERLVDAVTLIDHLKAIADHAVANLSPEFIRDLPAESFEAAAGLLQKTAGGTIGHGTRDYERALVWGQRAKAIYDWRDRRKARGWDDVPPPAPKKRATKAKAKKTAAKKPTKRGGRKPTRWTRAS